MRCKLKYGESHIAIDVPDYSELLTGREPDYLIDKKEFCGSLEEKLPEETEYYRNIAIVVADKTRLCGYPDFLPWIIESLLSKGASRETITFYIAYGTHPRQTDEESIQSYGKVYREYNFIHHDCTDNGMFATLGITKAGTSVAVRKDILESSLIITFGAISFHYFAGYGGGRKLIFPGLAKRESIYQNHGLFLDRKERKLAENCRAGILEGNPLAEDLKEIEEKLPPKISIHGILNSKGEVCSLKVGKIYHDFVRACQVHDSYFKLENSRQFDLVIASSGGYPKDINFIQAHKSVHYAAEFVKDGGKLVILTQCKDGIGSDYFLKFLRTGSFEKAFDILEKNYEGNGGTALSLMSKTNRITILMHTSLNEELCEILRVQKISERDIGSIIENEKGTLAVIQNASMLVYS